MAGTSRGIRYEAVICEGDSKNAKGLVFRTGGALDARVRIACILCYVGANMSARAVMRIRAVNSGKLLPLMYDICVCNVNTGQGAYFGYVITRILLYNRTARYTAACAGYPVMILDAGYRDYGRGNYRRWGLFRGLCLLGDCGTGMTCVFGGTVVKSTFCYDL